MKRYKVVNKHADTWEYYSLWKAVYSWIILELFYPGHWRIRKEKTSVNPIDDEEVESFGLTKRNAIKAAKDFHYGDDVIAKLKAAKDERAIDHIMTSARHKKFG